MTAVRYHCNPETGNVGICRATVKECRFKLSPEQHYSTREEARVEFEKRNSTSSLPKTVEKDSSLKENHNNSAESKETSDERNARLDRVRNDPKEFAKYQQNEIDMIRKNSEKGLPISDEEYERHREFLVLLRKNDDFPSTHKQFTKKIKGKLNYIPERKELHEKIIKTLTDRFSHIPNGNKAILTGGMPGSGKTTTLNKMFKDSDKYAMINPDDVKELMVEYEMMPDIPGTLPLERDQQVIYEAQKISDELYERLSKEGKNLIIDKTLLNVNASRKTLKELKDKGYQEIEVIFTDITPDQSYERIVSRHREGLDDYFVNKKGFGQRAVSGSAIAASQPEEGFYKSKNAETLMKLYEEGLFSKKPRIFDTSDGIKEVSFEDFKK